MSWTALKTWWRRLIDEGRGQTPAIPPPAAPASPKPKLDPYREFPPDVEKRRIPKDGD
jgi:hypothetical protein